MSAKKLMTMLLASILIAAVGYPVRGQQKQKPLSTKQAMALVTSATTPEDHERLAEYFNLKAAKLEAEAKEHMDLSNAYHKGKAPNMQNIQVCEDAAAAETKAAQADRSLAESHRKMAKDLGGGSTG